MKRQDVQSSSSGADVRSLATLMGGIVVIVLLAPPSAWALLVLGVSFSIGFIAHGRDVCQHIADVVGAARPRDLGFFDFLDGLEFAILGVFGTLLFIGINIVIWRWVQNQGAKGLTFLYLMVLGSVVLSVIRDLARLRLGPLTTVSTRSTPS